MANASVATGPAMEPDEERAHKRKLAELYADEAEQAVGVIEAKLAGMEDALAEKRAEAEDWRAEAARLSGKGE